MSSTTKYKRDLQREIAEAKQEAKALYSEVEHVKHRIHDTSLNQAASEIRGLEPHQISLKLYSTLRGHQNKIAQFRWNSSSTQIVSASQDGYLILWDVITGYKKHALVLESPWVLTCSISPNGKLVASGGLDNTVTIYNMSVKQSPFNRLNIPYNPIKAVLKGHRAYVSDTEFLDNSCLVSASGDMSCSLWDVEKGSKMRDFVDHLGDVLTISKFSNADFYSYSPIFVSGSSDGYAKIWDRRCQFSVQSFAVSNSDVNSTKAFPDNNSFITGSDDGIIRLFDLRCDCELGSYSLKSNLIATEDPNVRKLPLPSPTGLAHDQASRTESLDSRYNTPGILSLDMSKSGRLIYGCYADYGCVIWDTLKGEVVGKLGLTANPDKLSQVSVSPDGMALCTASWDQTIKVWAT